MKSYSVKEISDILGTNPETVRRWIRTGKLSSNKDSNKKGNLIPENELREFLKKTPKYACIAANSLLLTSPLGLPVALGGLTTLMIVDKVLENKKAKDKKIDSPTIIEYISKAIKETQKSIQEKEKSIEKLKEEIESEKLEIEKWNNLINNLIEKGDEK